jgi:molybdopterin-guanine dinucleotide biosynthesis protein A
VPGQPHTPTEALSLPLRCCLLSGGDSHRMGRDKALLPHPEGGTWLERSLLLLRQLNAPITLLSRHAAHLELAQDLNTARCSTTHRGHAVSITTLAEPPPWEGPLLALHRLMVQHPDQLLLLCPVDMPDLNLPVLQALLAAAAAESPTVPHLAHDGERLQPLLGLYPSSAPIRAHLSAAPSALADGAALPAGATGSQRHRQRQLLRGDPLQASR